MEKFIDKMILSRLSDRGLKILFWITSILSKVFLINLIIGFLMNLYSFGVNTHYGKLNEFISYNKLISLITDLVVPMIILFIPYILICYILKLVKEKSGDELDQSSIQFAIGVYLIIMNLRNLLGVFNSLSVIVQQLQWELKPDIFIILYPVLNTIIPIIYMLIGLKYIKMSHLLLDRIVEEK